MRNKKLINFFSYTMLVLIILFTLTAISGCTEKKGHSSYTIPPQVGITVRNYQDTENLDIVIIHEAGDMVSSGDWKLSIVPFGNEPEYIDSESDFRIGDKIITSTTTEGASRLTNNTLNGQVPFSADTQYNIMIMHIPTEKLLVDTVVRVY